MMDFFYTRLSSQTNIVLHIFPLGRSATAAKEHKPVFIGSIYRVSQEECARLRENVLYVKVHRYNPKHLYPKLNGYGGNGQRKVWSSCGSTYCTC